MDTKQALYTFGTGENFHLQHYLGAHKEQVDGVEGYCFRVWAPNAQAVHLVVFDLDQLISMRFMLDPGNGMKMEVLIPLLS